MSGELTGKDAGLFYVGRVRSSIKAVGEGPKQGTEGAPEAWIEIDPAFAPALDGLVPGQEVELLTWLHLADRTYLKVHPRGDRNNPLEGVFNTRSPDRPNPIGLHRVTILERTQTETLRDRIRVHPLEAVDGTPVIDIKPVLKQGGRSGLPDKACSTLKESCAALAAAGFMPGSSGSASIRLGPTVYLTRREAPKIRLAEQDVTALDIGTGKRLEQGRPDPDSLLHLAVYDAREDVRGAILIQPPAMMAALRHGVPDIADLPSTRGRILASRFRVLEAAAPRSEAQAGAVAEAAADSDALLLPGHGLLCFGPSLTDAEAMAGEIALSLIACAPQDGLPEEQIMKVSA